MVWLAVIVIFGVAVGVTVGVAVGGTVGATVGVAVGMTVGVAVGVADGISQLPNLTENRSTKSDFWHGFPWASAQKAFKTISKDAS